jgi:hypothetical protein
MRIETSLSSESLFYFIPGIFTARRQPQIPSQTHGGSPALIIAGGIVKLTELRAKQKQVDGLSH